MGACNSHKCHCPRCMATRRSAEIELNNRIDDRIARHDRDALRREAWKRRARQHHVDQAGVCCAPHASCTCPNCIEVREFYTLRPGERIAKIRTTILPDGWKINWIWVRLPHGWRRKDIATQKFFGETVTFRSHYPKRATGEAMHHIRTRTVGAASIKDEVIVYSTNPNSAENWVRSMFTDPPTRMTPEQATECVARYRERYGLDTPWADPPRKSVLVTPEVRATFLDGDWNEKKETPMLTVLQLAILSHHIVHPGVPYPYSCTTTGFGHVNQALEELVIAEFLERRPEGGYKITHRTTVYFRAINTLPLPVRKQAPWVMPE